MFNGLHLTSLRARQGWYVVAAGTLCGAAVACTRLDVAPKASTSMGTASVENLDQREVVDAWSRKLKNSESAHVTLNACRTTTQFPPDGWPIVASHKLRAPRRRMRAPGRSSDVLIGAEHVLNRPEHVLSRPEHSPSRSEHSLNRPERVLSVSEHVLSRSENVPRRSEHVLRRSERVLSQSERVFIRGYRGLAPHCHAVLDSVVRSAKQAPLAETSSPCPIPFICVHLRFQHFRGWLSPDPGPDRGDGR